MNDKIALIFACGASIKDDYKTILKLVKKYSKKDNSVTVGINRFPNKFVETFYQDSKHKSLAVDYWMFSDIDTCYPVVKNYEKQKLIINEELGQKTINWIKNNCNVDTVFKPDSIYGQYSTTVRAIQFFLEKKYKVIVFGMDNKLDINNKWEHFYSDNEKNNPYLDKSIDQIIDIQYEIKELNKLGEIYKVSKNNNINVPLIDINKLLKGEIIVAEDKVIEQIEQIVEATVDQVVEKTEEVFTHITGPFNKKDLTKLQLPWFSKSGGTLFINDYLYEIVDKTVEVLHEHALELLKQGFKVI